MAFWLGIDCGGTFIKAGIYDDNGQEYGTFRKNLTVINEYQGWAERDLNELWSSCAGVIKGVLQQSNIAPGLVKGVGISAQGKGVFLLDKQQRPLGRGILSSDQRSLDIVRNWQQQNIPQKLYPITRQTLWTGHPVSILRWLKEHQPECYSNIGTVFMSHDYLRFCLTGKIACEVTNISESNLYSMQTGEYDTQLASLLGIEEVIPCFAPIIQSSEIAGYLTEKAAKETGLVVGTPVMGGLFDVVSTAICSGIQCEQKGENSKLNVVLGTWTVVSGITDYIDESQKLPFVYGRYAQRNQFLVHEASPTSAANLEWFTKQWPQLSYDEINQMIEELPKAESSILFVPFLYGSNAGLGMSAGFYGLQSLHTTAHLLQAVYEGVLFSLMTHLERVLKRFPTTKVLRLTGGPARSKVWMQMLADLSGLPIEIPIVSETGCLGAALAAMVGGRIYPDFTTAQQQLQHEVLVVSPDWSAHEKYREKYYRYTQFVNALKTLV
ncbi:xylulose kinase [Gallibacterium salpingitidis]|uniref:Xylulose kinase n=1 Tax=Gallibacterium salpingitidis TaxID=505341 RepID=A0A1A7PZM1_9PAST|nr:FGGY-family carbohydrate kinase [Gallibacterium salpingitidis]OBW93369.1 xylulose kinase [Gallibacterium salpingitidis]OBX07464.1 xylulose kinase [Gallibacterium salpingitidis]OBX10827.1 xylulose kinase [Gallibacterium salpingitidis]